MTSATTGTGIYTLWGAELLANARFFNAWVAENSSLAAGHLVSANR